MKHHWFPRLARPSCNLSGKCDERPNFRRKSFAINDLLSTEHFIRVTHAFEFGACLALRQQGTRGKPTEQNLSLFNDTASVALTRVHKRFCDSVKLRQNWR